jgi:hypothetical protein
MDWQPIETAPKSGMFIWGYWEGEKFQIGLSYRTVTKKNFDAYGMGDVHRFATYWHPLPLPPERPL